jgi:hypothetical protein
MTKKRPCLDCSKELIGRIDKIFCDQQCKSAYHYRKNKEKKITLFARIDKQLKLNRTLLQHFNRAGKSTLREEKLLEAGFDPNYFTHYWKNSKGQVYLFCYDVGYLKLKENGRHKYLLIDWQAYMGTKE